MATDCVEPLLAALLWEEDQATARVEYLPGRWIDLCLYFEPDETSRELMLRHARAALLALLGREVEYRRWTADRLVGKNWSDPPLSADAIFDLLTVATLEVSGEDEFRIFWDDQEELFGGHNVATHLDLRGECVDARMW